MYHHITGRITADHVEPLKMEVVTRYVVIDNTTPDNIASVAAIQFLAHPYLHCGVSISSSSPSTNDSVK